MIKLRDARKIIDVLIPYLPLLPKIKNNIFFHEIKAIKTDNLENLSAEMVYQQIENKLKLIN